MSKVENAVPMTKLQAVRVDGSETPAALPDGGHATSAASRPMAPDPEVLERPVRRKFKAEFKRRIVEETAACTAPGEVGALLRRHGLYSSHLVDWRRQYEQGALAGLEPRRRGCKPQEKNPLADKVARLERDLRRAQARAERAERLVELQKKVSELLGIALEQPDESGERR